MQSFDPKAPRPYAVEYVANPSQDELRRLALDHTPAVLRTAHGNLDKISRNKSRVAQYTYVISDDPDAGRKLSAKTIDSAAAADLIRRQREYIEDRGRLIQIDGYLGLGERAAKVQWLYTLERTRGAISARTASRARVREASRIGCILGDTRIARRRGVRAAHAADTPGRYAIAARVGRLGPAKHLPR